MVKVYLLEYTINGKSQYWPESLQKKTAKHVKQMLGVSGLESKVIVLKLSRKEIKRITA